MSFFTLKSMQTKKKAQRIRLTTMNNKNLKNSSFYNNPSEISFYTIKSRDTSKKDALPFLNPKPIKRQMRNATFNKIKDYDLATSKLQTFYSSSKQKSIETDDSYIKQQMISKDESCFIDKLMIGKSSKKFHVTINEELFTDPKSSLQTLKINKAVMKEMNILMTETQAKSFEKTYNKFKYQSLKMKKMPKPRVTLLAPKESEIAKLASRSIELKAPIQTKSSKNDLVNELVRRKMLRDSINFYCFLIKQNSKNPSSRTYPTITILQNKVSTVLLSCGLSTCPMLDFWFYETKKNKWEKIKVTGECFLPRYGHTTVNYKNLIYIFGGAIPKNNMIPIENIIIFNTDDHTIKEGKFKRAKFTVPFRRNHIAELVSNTMIVHGGICEDTNGPITLCDFMSLDLSAMMWTKLDIVYKGLSEVRYLKQGTKRHFVVKPPQLKLSYHSSCLVLSQDNQAKTKLNIYDFSKGNEEEENKKTISEMIKYEGIYIFGGIDENGDFNNSMYILHLGRNPLVCYKPVTNGKLPSKRYGCSMNYYQNMNYIIIYGGRSRDSFNDMFIFDILSFDWLEVKLFGCQNPPRAEHSSCIIDNNLYIFGGCNEENFISAKWFVVSLDFYKNQRTKRVYDFCVKELNETGIDKLKSNNNFANDLLNKIKFGSEISDDIYNFI